MTPSTPILHHFTISPFAEKMRLALGFKRLPWRSVLIPPTMPKPDVLALTGGYRRTPLLQLSADIYCDTALAAQAIEALQVAPPLFPAAAPLAPAVAMWADSKLFWQAIGVTQHPAARAKIFEGLSAETIQAFAVDRAAFTASHKRARAADASAQFSSALTMLDATLTGHPWLMGSEPSIADFSIYHCLWFVARAGLAETLLQPRAALWDWYARMSAFSRPPVAEMSSAEALNEARNAPGHAAVAVQPGLGFEAGEAVTVAATDYGTEPSAGELVGLTIDRVTLRRTDERAGVVHVHFPRNGFEILKAEAPKL